MTDARKWWVGLAPLAALWVAGNWFGTDHVEKDLAARAAAAVEQAGGSVQPPRIEARGRDISVATIAADPAAANRIGTAILQQTGVRLVDVGGMALPPLARPFPFAATREGATLTLTGSVPSEAVRLKIVDAAKAIPAVTVVDRLTVARGAPGRV